MIDRVGQEGQGQEVQEVQEGLVERRGQVVRKWLVSRARGARVASWHG